MKAPIPRDDTPALIERFHLNPIVADARVLPLVALALTLVAQSLDIASGEQPDAACRAGDGAEPTTEDELLDPRITNAERARDISGQKELAAVVQHASTITWELLA